MNLLPFKGQLIRIAQDSFVGEYIKEDKTMYFRERLDRSTVAIYLGQFFEHNEHQCKVIIGDKIRFVAQQDIRDINNFKYHGIKN